MSNYRRAKNLLVSVAMTGALAACGGGSGGGNEGGNNRLFGNFDAGTQVSESEFDIFSGTGVWLSEGFFNYRGTQEYRDVKVDFELDTSLTSVTSVLYNSSTDVVGRDCDELGPVQASSDYFNFEDEEIFSPEEDDFDLCQTNSTNYYKMSPTNYGIEIICDSEVFASFEFTKLSNSSDLNFGSLSFTSNTYDDLNSNDSVCGGFTEGTVKATYEQPNPYDADNTETQYDVLSIGALYGNSAIYFEFEVEGKLSTGTYSVVDYYSDQGPNQIYVDISSGEFGGSTDYPVYLSGDSGTVTIQSISGNSASGTFEITTYNGATFTGSFSFDLN